MVKSNDGHIEANPMPAELKTFIASSAKCSTTRYINPIRFKFTNANNEVQTVTAVDTPGTGDTNGPEVDISNSIGIQKSILKCSKVYPIIIFTQRLEGGQAEILKQ